MVKNIPESQDYIKTGRELLDISWGMIKDLLETYNESEFYGFDKEEISDKYWSLSTRRLNSALAITQQGIEFLLKGKICEISPYLLISEPPSNWPSTQKNDLDFSQFRTIDAQDLVKVHDTFSTDPLDPRFTTMFNKFRELRNAIMHSIGGNIKISHIDIIDSQIAMHKLLFPNDSWVKIRIEALKNSPDTTLGSDWYINDIVNNELALIIDLLPPQKVYEYFKIDKKSRPYYCPDCYSENDTKEFAPKLARLISKKPDCNAIYCPVCEAEYEIARKDCTEDCPGNVISELYGICLTCGD